MSAAQRVAVTLALAVLCATALVVDRSLQFAIGRDSSVFLYVATVVRDGGVPYRDVWDHKPPLLYYVDVVGLALADLGVDGVAVVEFAALFGAALAGFWAMRHALGALPALFGSLAWIVALSVVLNGGNRPEEYALPLQLGAIALYVAERSRPSGWRWAAIGVAAGAAVLFKPTVLGVWAAMYLIELTRAWRARSALAIARPLLLGAAGALAVTLPMAAYFVASGAGGDLLDQVIRFNSFYAQATLAERLAAVRVGATLMTFAGLLPVALAGWAVALVRLARGSAPPRARPLTAVAALALPIDTVLAAATGKPYHEYWLACLPALGVLAGVAASGAEDAIRRAAARASRPTGRLAAATFAAGALLLVSAIPARAAYRDADGPNDQERTRPVAEEYVRAHTAGADRVLFWGAEAGLNYTTGRRAPTRYAYQFALYLRGYQSAERVDELLGALERDPPALIIDASPATRDVPPLDRSERRDWTMLEPTYTLLPEMERLFGWIEARYVRVDRIGVLGWSVYRPR